MITEYKWRKDSIALVEGGGLLFDWLDKAKNQGERILFICGAGISMTGSSPAPAGWNVGSSYENFLRNQGESIPTNISGNIAKLYEYFCYPKNENGDKSFSKEKHNEFIDAITTPIHDFNFSGRPNFQHNSLLNEVIDSKGNIRIYSLNLDEFFDIAAAISGSKPQDVVVNAADLIGKHKSDRVFSDWSILAAHGKNVKNTNSVWSEGVLIGDIGEDSTDHLSAERKILESSVNCINEGPYYDKIIFVGIAAPLSYLINPLKKKLTPKFQWIWINPFDEPQEWLINSEENLFNENNGNWIKTGLTESLWQAHARFYERWLRSSCNGDTEKLPLLERYKNERHKKVLVESIYRARRIYDNGIKGILNTNKNRELLDNMNDDHEVYTYPHLVSGNRYHDSFLGESLHKLFLSKIELSRNPSEKSPQLTIANKFSEVAPVSVHIFKFELVISDAEVAQGIAKTFDDAFIDPNHRHVIIIDVKHYDIKNLIKAINLELSTRFPNDYSFIDVVTSKSLDGFLNDNDFSNPPERALRP